MTKIIKNTLKYGLPLLLGWLLIAHTYRDVHWPTFMQQVQTMNFVWLFVGITLSWLSHFIRAYRWSLMVVPLGFQVSTYKSFLALMISYMSNLFIPRIGEVTRCTVLRIFTKIPISMLLGTVITERIIDFIGLLVVIGLSFLLSQSEVTNVFCQMGLMQKNNFILFNYLLLILLLIVLIISFIYYNWRSYFIKQVYYKKLTIFFQHAKQGCYSILKSKAKNLILITSILKWGIYYLSDTISLWALSSSLPSGNRIGLVILMMSSISFAVPVQGGIGAYHILISSVLLNYGIAKENALAYAGFTHGLYVLSTIIWGSIGMVFLKQWQKKHSFQKNPSLKGGGF